MWLVPFSIKFTLSAVPDTIWYDLVRARTETDIVLDATPFQNSSMPYPQQLGRILGTGYAVINAGNSGKNMLKKGLCGGGGNCCGHTGPDGMLLE